MEKHFCKFSFGILVWGLFVFGPAALAIEMTAERFNSLPLTRQKEVFIKALEEQQRNFRNLKVTGQSRTYFAGYLEGKIGKITNLLERIDYQYKKVEDSYFLSDMRYRREDTDWIFITETNYIADTGISRGYTRHKQLKRLYGSIDKRQDNIVQFHRYLYCLGGQVDETHDSYIRQLIKHQNEIRFEKEAGHPSKILAVVSDTYSWEGKPMNIRKIWVDPSKGFLITRMVRQLEVNIEKGKTSWQEEIFNVEESKKIDGIWFPVKTNYIFLSPRYKPNTAAVVEDIVRSIEVGKLTKKDLEIVFPAGTEVRDKVAGTEYTAKK